MRKIQIENHTNSTKVTETLIDGMVLEPRYYSLSSELTLNLSRQNQYYKDLGQPTYQLVDKNGNPLHAPALFNEFELDGVTPASVDDLFVLSDTIDGLKPQSGSGGGGTIDTSTLATEATLSQLIARAVETITGTITAGAALETYDNTTLLTAIGYAGALTEYQSIQVLSENKNAFDLKTASDTSTTTNFTNLLVAGTFNQVLDPFTLDILANQTVTVIVNLYK